MMPQRDLNARLVRLYADEPSPSRANADQWLDRYIEFVDLLEGQLIETQVFAANKPAGMRDYIQGYNVAILEEELDAARKRMEYWKQHCD